MAKFAPEYNEPNTVRLGKSTTVAGIMAALAATTTAAPKREAPKSEA